MENQPKKTVLITGASSGIGRELARLFAKDGYTLVVVGRHVEMLEQLAATHKNQYGTETIIIQKDLQDPAAPSEIYAETQAKQLSVDVLVNDAGVGEYGQFATETDFHKELGIIQVNAVALVHLTKLYLKEMMERKSGKILMLGSEVSVIPNPMMAVYGATKAFIKSFSEAIRSELQGTNVTVTLLMPGATSTNFFAAAGAAHTKTADPAQTANPADVAKEGYAALMQGQDHVVAGWRNKARMVAAHLLPDPLLAASVRANMAPKVEDSPKQVRSLALKIGFAAGLAAGLYVTYRQSTGFRKGLYPTHSRKARKAARQTINRFADSVKDAYQTVKSVASQ